MAVLLVIFFLFSVGYKRKFTPDPEDVPVKIKKEDLSLEMMIEIESHLIEEKRFEEFTKKVGFCFKWVFPREMLFLRRKEFY